MYGQQASFSFPLSQLSFICAEIFRELHSCYPICMLEEVWIVSRRRDRRVDVTLLIILQATEEYYRLSKALSFLYFLFPKAPVLFHLLDVPHH